jgi:hypothetical protein
MSPQHVRPGSRQVLPPQQVWFSSQQLSPQLLPSPRSQQLLPAQPAAGGSQGVPSHWSTRSAQTALKQLPKQHSLARVQELPFGCAQRRWSEQQTVPAGQLAAVQRHCRCASQAVPAGQLGTQAPVASQQPVRQLCASQTHACPRQAVPVGQAAQRVPPVPHSTLLVPASQVPASSGPAVQQPSGQVWGMQTHCRSLQTVPVGQATQRVPPAPHSWLRVPASQVPASLGPAVQQPLGQLWGVQTHSPPDGGGTCGAQTCVLAQRWHGSPAWPQA